MARHHPQALGILRGDEWVEEIGEGLTELEVRVKQPAVEHRVRMKDFRQWLESQGRTPAECTRKRKLMGVGKKGRKGTVICGGGLLNGSSTEWRLYIHVEFPTASAFHESERIRFEPKGVAFYSQTG